MVYIYNSFYRPLGLTATTYSSTTQYNSTIPNKSIPTMFSVSTASTSTIGATTLRTLSTASRPLLLGTTHLILRQACPRAPLAARSFHSTPAQQLKLSLPWSHKGAALKNPADAAAVSKDGPSFATESWPHPVYSREEMQAIVSTFGSVLSFFLCGKSCRQTARLGDCPQTGKRLE